MVKYLLPYCLLFFTAVPLYTCGQSFEISQNEIHIDGKVGDRIEIPLSIKNLTSSPLSLIIQRTENNIGNGQASYICWEKDCAENTSLHKKLDAKKTNNYIVATLEAGLAGGYSSVRYHIYNKNNPLDARDLIIHYNIEDPVYKKEIYSSQNIIIKDVYPNPVSDELFITYKLEDFSVKAKIGIHNVLGSMVSEFQLEPMDTKALINTTDLNSGVYFYSLTLNNETVLIKKFIVRK